MRREPEGGENMRTRPRKSARAVTLDVLAKAGARGVTCHEVSSRSRLDVNTSSARLATLKGQGIVVRTTTRRRGCSVYVLAEHVGDDARSTTRRRVAELPSIVRRVESRVDRAKVLDALDDVRLALDYGRVAVDTLDALLDEGSR